MKKKFSLLLALSLLAANVLPALASTATTFGNVTLTTPNTYGSCSATGDTLSITGLTNLNNTYSNPDVKFKVTGWVDAQFVLPGGGRQSFQYQAFTDQTTDFTVTVNYPPAGQWPLTDATFNTAEIHVDLSFELIAYNTTKGIVEFMQPTLGPGTDWDVYCQNSPKFTNPGTGTPGYWKTHPEAWPVASITLGGITYSEADALVWLGLTDGDKRVTMFRSLVSAKLNVLIGNDDSCIAGTIAAADAWWAQYNGAAVAGKSAAWKAGEPLYTALDNYNNGLLCVPHRN